MEMGPKAKSDQPQAETTAAAQKSRAEQFNAYASGIQSSIAGLAILVAGIWALYTFWALGSVERSRAETAEIEQKIATEPDLKVDIRWSADRQATQTDQRSVIFSVGTRNDGNQPLDMVRPILHLARLRGGQGHTYSTAGQPIALSSQVLGTATLTEAPDRILRARQSRTLLFAARGLTPGLYFIQFSTYYFGVDLGTASDTSYNSTSITVPLTAITAIEQRVARF